MDAYDNDTKSPLDYFGCLKSHVSVVFLVGWLYYKSGAIEHLKTAMGYLSAASAASLILRPTCDILHALCIFHLAGGGGGGDKECNMIAAYYLIKSIESANKIYATSHASGRVHLDMLSCAQAALSLLIHPLSSDTATLLCSIFKQDAASSGSLRLVSRAMLLSRPDCATIWGTAATRQSLCDALRKSWNGVNKFMETPQHVTVLMRQMSSGEPPLSIRVHCYESCAVVYIWKCEGADDGANVCRDMMFMRSLERDDLLKAVVVSYGEEWQELCSSCCHNCGETAHDDDADDTVDGTKQSIHGMYKCSRCKGVLYCSKQCQKDDWPMHRLFCCRA
jgi:hypothetical protein